MSIIKDLKSREVLDSRGNPTVEVTLFTENGSFVSSVPSGASRGSSEAVEIRDGGERYAGKGVLRAVENINKKIMPLVKEREIIPQEIDKIILEADGTSNKSNFGANAILGVSMSVFRAAAKENALFLYDYIASEFSFSKKLPVPCFNLINGGAHSGGELDFQEFMIVPSKENFKENLRFGGEFLKSLRARIVEEFGESSVNIGDEGGFALQSNSVEEALSLLTETGKTSFIIDVAASEFLKNGKYFFQKKERDREEMIQIYKKLVEKFNILGLEDPLEEEDFFGWGDLQKKLNDVLIIGDDLLTTNKKRMEKAKEEKSCNAMILKMNQIGSVTETLFAAETAKSYGWKIIVSHRSGETNDDFISDLAVGIGADYIKSGAPQRGERVAKYNRLLQIEEEIKEHYE